MSPSPDWLAELADRDRGTPARSTRLVRDPGAAAPGTANAHHRAEVRAWYRRRKARRP